MKRYVIVALFLAACGGNEPNLTPSENPAVAISKVDGPLVGGRPGPLVDAVDTLQPRSGELVVAAAQQYNPVNGQITDNPISVYVTASDELGVDSVELSLDGTSMGTYLKSSEGQAFKNPFIFPAPRSGLESVPIPGAVSGFVSSELRALASDTTGQLSEAAVLRVQADGSRPNITHSVVGSGPPYLGPVALGAQAFDPETGMRGFNAFLNGEELPINPKTPFSLDVVMDPEPGVQTVRLVAENGVFVPNEVVFTFVVAEEPPTSPTDPPTTPPTDPPTPPPPPTDPPTTPPPPTDPPPTNPPPPTDPPTTPPTDPPTDPEDNTAPSVSLTATPTTGDAPLTVVFTANAEDADGDTLSYAWNFDNGETASGSDPKSVTYSEVGSYDATVTVIDGNGGQATAQVSVAVSGGDNTAPGVSLSAVPTTGDAPLTVSFTANAEDADGDTLTYAWDFGNGETASSGDTQSVTYSADGSYTATVTITDGNGGEAVAQAQITVGSGGGDGGATAPTVTSFTANGREMVEVRPNTEVTLAWEIDGIPTGVAITSSSGGEQDVTADDDRKLTVSPDETTTYTISATNDAGTTTETVEVVVDDNGGVDAANDSAATRRNRSVTVGVLGNDKPGPRALIIVAATTPRQGGTVEISRDSKTIVYTPADGFVGEDTFAYTVSDKDGNRARANVTVQVGR